MPRKTLLGRGGELQKKKVNLEHTICGLWKSSLCLQLAVIMATSVGFRKA